MLVFHQAFPGGCGTVSLAAAGRVHAHSLAEAAILWCNGTSLLPGAGHSHLAAQTASLPGVILHWIHPRLFESKMALNQTNQH